MTTMTSTQKPNREASMRCVRLREGKAAAKSLKTATGASFVDTTATNRRSYMSSSTMLRTRPLPFTEPRCAASASLVDAGPQPPRPLAEKRLGNGRRNARRCEDSGPLFADRARPGGLCSQALKGGGGRSAGDYARDPMEWGVAVERARPMGGADGERNLAKDSRRGDHPLRSVRR